MTGSTRRMNVRPFSLKAYSTRGGISSNAARETRPRRCRSARESAKVRVLTPRSARRNCPKRSTG